MDIPGFLSQAAPWLAMALDHRTLFQPALTRIRDWFYSDGSAPEFAENPRQILILGAGGCGKSTLGLLLSSPMDFHHNTELSYTESLFTDTFELESNPAIEIVVPPGQEYKREFLWAEPLSAISNGQVRGIIIVNSYGYHSLGQIGYKEHRLYREFNNKRDFVRAYLENRRLEELKVIETIAPHISACRERMWVLSVVNKEDLWWKWKAEVASHYRTGRYNEAIQDAIGPLGANRSIHETVFMSLIIGNLGSCQGEVLCKHSADYDSTQQMQSIKAAIATIQGLIDWERSG